MSDTLSVIRGLCDGTYSDDPSHWTLLGSVAPEGGLGHGDDGRDDRGDAVMSTDLDVCPHCGGEIRFGEREHHLDEACVPARVVHAPGFAGRMPRPEIGGIFREAQRAWENARAQQGRRR